MGSIASCGDNAAVEWFCSLLQRDVLDPRSCATREERRIAIVIWAERTCRRRRREARLGCLAPFEFEAIPNEDVTLAA